MAQKMTEVGGVPIFYCASGTSTTPVAVTLTTPAGFSPSYIRSTVATATNPDVYEWFYGMGAATAIKTTGGTGIPTYISSNGFTVSTGSIILGTSVQGASVDYCVTAYRYSNVTTSYMGGLYPCFATSGTSANTPAAVAVTVAAGFNPDFIRVVSDYNATNPLSTTWIRGMANPGGITVDADGVVTPLTTTGITVAAGTITLGTGVQVADGNYHVFAARYSQVGNVDVGGCPIFFTASGTSAGSEAAVAITTAKGFYPDWVMCIDDYDATNPSPTEWFKSQANPSAILTTGSTGVNTLLTTTGITVADGTVTIGTGCQVNSGNYLVFAARYSA